jgi:hypothetical protein
MRKFQASPSTGQQLSRTFTDTEDALLRSQTSDTGPNSDTYKLNPV